MNELSYALKLDGRNFEAGMSRAGQSLAGFGHKMADLTGVGAMLAAGFAAIKGSLNIVEGVKAAIEKGAKLNDLAKQTGESVGNVYKLQRGFAAVGLDASSATDRLFSLQKSLGGVNEIGEDTKSVFAMIGLNFQQMKQMDAPAQFRAIANQLNRLSDEKAASIASKIFGRNGAREMLQLARSGNEFAEGIERAARGAEVFQRNAGAFEQIDKTLALLRGKTGIVFASIAEGAAPGIQSTLNKLNNIDLTRLGRRLGVVVGGAFQAFNEGRLTELIAVSVQGGFEAGFAVLPGLFEVFGALLLKQFEPLEIVLEAEFQHLFEVEMASLKKLSQLRSDGGLPVGKIGAFLTSPFLGFLTTAAGKNVPDNFKADSFDEIYQQVLRDGVKFGNLTLDQLMKQAGDDFADGLKKAKDKMSAVLDKYTDFNSRLDRYSEEGQQTGDRFDVGADKGKKVDVSNLEKMGFIMSNNHDAALDYARQTANATRSMDGNLRAFLGAIGKTPKISLVTE